MKENILLLVAGVAFVAYLVTNFKPILVITLVCSLVAFKE